MPLTLNTLGDSPMLHEDIRDRRIVDRERNPITLALLQQRLAAVEQAEQHTFHRGEYQPFELRQMLIDLAAAAEEWASGLPEPRVLTLRQERRRAAA